MKKKIIQITVVSLFLILITVMILHVRKDNLDAVYIEAVKDVIEDRKDEHFTPDQAQKIKAYFATMRESGYSNPKFESYVSDREKRLYLLVKSDSLDEEIMGVCYVILEFDESFNTVQNVITSSWVKVGDKIKNF